jgi:hypothetical protein
MRRLVCCFGVLGVVVACSSSSTTTASNSPLPFKASNVDITGWDLSKIGDVDLNRPSCPTDGEEAGTPDGLIGWFCDVDFNNHILHKIVTQSDGSKVSVFVMKNFKVEAGTTFELQRGSLPVIIIATGTIDILGTIAIDPGISGGWVNPSGMKTKGAGPGGGAAGDDNGMGAGGASYCGAGGKGGLSTQMGATTMQASPTAAYGSPTLVPLLAGSAGGLGGFGLGGLGGGALQLTAGTSFNLRASGVIKGGGGGGYFGGQALKDSAGGGGSGGAVLIESQTATVDGKIAVNGGGGGQGNGGNGDDGAVDAIAKGGHNAHDTVGGDGSFGPTINGTDGTNSATIAASGGGGGAGRIRINTTSGVATITGTLSPPVTTPCATQGKLTSL